MCINARLQIGLIDCYSCQVRASVRKIGPFIVPKEAVMEKITLQDGTAKSEGEESDKMDVFGHHKRVIIY